MTRDSLHSHFERLKRKIEDRSAVVGICGLGYVGLPLARTISASGFRVSGFDIDASKVEQLNAGRSYIRHIPAALIEAMVAEGKLRATTKFDEIEQMDI